MNDMRRTKVFQQIAVRLIGMAIGWHFLYEGCWKMVQQDGWSCLSYLNAAQGPLAPVFKWMAGQAWIVTTGDWAVQLGLVAIGLSLITGVFSRITALAGIALMAMFYCCQPPEPFATAMSGADGRFFILERNAVEALGLLLVAAMPSARKAEWMLLPGVAVLAAFQFCFCLHGRSGGFEKVEAVTSATVKVHEFTALAALKAPFAEKATVGGVEISRLALDGELIAGHAHARDLIWTDEFMRRYNSGVTLGRTVRYCLHCGVNAVFAEPQFLAPMSAEAKNADKELKFFANCANEQDAKLAAEGGAKGVYVRPETADALARKGDADGLKKLFASLEATTLPVGVGAEDVATVKFCVTNGLAPAYWVLAFHSIDYPAARMETKCDNIWCVDPKAAADYMKTRPEPWVAIRGLAGGAIDPVKAYSFAKGNGATAVAIDLLDYRIVETVNGIVSPAPPPPKKNDKDKDKNKDAKDVSLPFGSIAAVVFGGVVLMALLHYSKVTDGIEKWKDPVATAVRFAVGWHLAYLGVWAITSTWDYSWAGCFRCAHWLFGDALRAVGHSAAMDVVDVCLAWGLLVVGVVLMLGRFARVAAVFGILYFALVYVLNPPHFGHTGESHFLYIDRNVVEICMLLFVMAWRKDVTNAAKDEVEHEEDQS